MSSGFIDPDTPERERLDRLELLVTEVLADMPVTRESLSPRAKEILDDLLGKDEARKARAQQEVARLMAEDPLDAGEAAPLVEPPDPEPVIKFRITLVESDVWSGRSRSTEDYDTYEEAEARIKEVNSQNTSPVAPSYYVQAEKTITAVQVDQP